MFWFWIIIALLVGGSVGVVTMSMMFVAKDTDRKLAEYCSKPNCTKACKGWELCDNKW